MSSAVGSEFRAWLNDFTYDCTVVRADPVVSLYVSHRAMAVKRLRVLSSEQSATIIELSEQHAAEAGWTTSRHANYATTDIPVSATYELHNFLNGADQLGQQIADKISDDLGLAAAPLWGLTPREMFVVKYTGADCDAGSALGCGQSSLGLYGNVGIILFYWSAHFPALPHTRGVVQYQSASQSASQSVSQSVSPSPHTRGCGTVYTLLSARAIRMLIGACIRYFAVFFGGVFFGSDSPPGTRTGR